MKNKSFPVIFIISLILLALSCLQTLEPNYGTLTIQINWQTESVMVSEVKDANIAGARSITKNVPGNLTTENLIPDEITKIRLILQPGDLVFEFAPSESNLTIEVDLGIYNISIEALNDSGLVVYSGTAEIILVESFKTTTITIQMEPNFPYESPVFLGLLLMNSSTTGTYQLQWSACDRANLYRLEESSDNSFTTSTAIYSGPDTSYQVENQPEGTYYYRVRGENEIGVSLWSDWVSFQVQFIPELIIATESLPDGKVGMTYDQSVTAEGGTIPYSWSVSAGSLPDGLSLNTSFGQISGTPTASDTWDFTVQVTDNSSPTQTDTQELSITIDPLDLEITTASPLPDGTQGTFYSQNIEAEGGSDDWSWSMTGGTLPAGITFSDFGETGRVEGTPTESGTFNFTIQVTDNVYPGLSDTKSFSLTINPSTLTITTTSLPDGQVGVYYNRTVSATGGTEPYTWSISSGTLPFGLSLNTSTGRISGTPTSSDEWAFTIHVTDDSSPSQSDTQELSIDIYPAGLEITTSSPLPDYKAGTDYNQQIEASGGALPYTWTLTNRSPLGFAEGINLSADGVLSGNINSQPETGQLTIQVTDNSSPSQDDTKIFDLTITAGDLALLNAFLLDGQVGVGYWGYICYRYGTSPLESPWTITGNLPPGVTMSYTANNYQLNLSGMPTTAGTFNFSVTIRDSGSPQQTRTDSYSITINP